MDDDDNVIDLNRAGIAAGTDTVGVQPNWGAENEAGSTLPLPDDDYLACGRTSNSPEIMLCFILRDQSYELFSYGSLVRARLAAPAMPGAGRALLLRFVEAGVTDVKLEGVGLLALVHNLRRHRIPWLRETPTSLPFRARQAVVITRIHIGHGEGAW